MSAARIRAAQLARPSWWQRTVALLRRSYVLALATVMVLVGSVVMLGRRSEKIEAKPAAQEHLAPSATAQDFARARAAATRGDCAAALALAGRIANEDPEYYR